MNLKDMMHGEAVTTLPSAPVTIAAQLMELRNVGSVIVVQDGKPVGILTDRDIVVRVVSREHDPREMLVEQVMTREPTVLRQELGLYETLEAIKGAQARRFPVVDGTGALVGVVSLDDLVPLISKELGDITSIISRERWIV
jgi:CBS domain-containing protein